MLFISDLFIGYLSPKVFFSSPTCSMPNSLMSYPLSANSNLAVSSSSSAALTADKGDFVISVVGWVLSEEARSYARQNNQDYCYSN